MKTVCQTFMGRLAFVTITFILGAAPLVAQQVRPTPGDRIRVQVAGESGRRIFTLKEVIADTLVLGGATEGTQETRMPVSSISRLQVSAGHQSAGTRAARGAGYGFGSGFVIGGLIGLASGNDSGFLAFTAEEKAVFAGAVLGATGLVLGTIVGVSSQSERWKSIPLQHITMTSGTNGTLVIGFRGVL